MALRIYAGAMALPLVGYSRLAEPDRREPGSLE